jgi:hypothetical protein
MAISAADAVGMITTSRLTANPACGTGEGQLPPPPSPSPTPSPSTTTSPSATIGSSSSATPSAYPSYDSFVYDPFFDGSISSSPTADAKAPPSTGSTAASPRASATTVVRSTSGAPRKSLAALLALAVAIAAALW